MENRETTVRVILGQYFDHYVNFIKCNNQIWLVKSYYSPFNILESSHFIIDAYYIASNKMYSQLEIVLNEMRILGINAERYKGKDYKELLVRSGLSYGCRRNSLAYDELGSRFVIGAITLPLETIMGDSESISEHINFLTLCGNCMKCVDACPTKALSAMGLDASKCLRHYMNIGKFPNKAVAKKAGLRLLGCDICQDVCPHNSQVRKEMPIELKEIFKIDGFFERLKSAKPVLTKHIGANYSKVEWLGKLASQLNNVEE